MKKLLLLLLLSPLSVFCQFKKELPSYITTFLAGAFEGTSETLKWHYYEFEEAFPNANSQFWDPKYSYQNKYKNGITAMGPKFFGSTSFLVWTTDGYHMSNFGRNSLLFTTLVIHPREKKKFKFYMVDLLAHLLIYKAGFHLTYDIAFKSKFL